jgi:putative transposase
MRYAAAEKLEVIRLVERSHLPARQTLLRLGIPPATFYRWYDRYREHGPEGLEDRSPKPGRVWNRIPELVRERILALALEAPDFVGPGVGRPLHRPGEVFRLRGFGLSAAQGA